MKKQCVVCKKNKKIMVENSTGKDICRVCSKVHPQIEIQMGGLEMACSVEASTPQEFYQANKAQIAAEVQLENTIQEVQQDPKQNRLKMINFILNKVEQIHIKSYQKKLPEKNLEEVKKTLEEYNEFSLEQCAETVESATSFEDIRGLGMAKKIKHSLDLPDPKKLYENLSAHIIDQEDAVKTISSAIVKHFCRVKDPSIKKQNIFIMGPTGSGKTELIRTLAAQVKIPLVTIDASSLTASGYRGNTAAELIISSLMRLTNNDLKLSENAIVFIDEIDKKAHTADHGSVVGTMSVQQELLKIIEGGVISTEIPNPNPSNKNPNPLIKIDLDTSNILFIAAGAFSGIERLVDTDKKTSMGLNAKKPASESTKEYFKKVSNQTLIRYGLMPEFIGRFSVITHTNHLSISSLIKILNKPDGIVQQYQKMYSQFSCDLNFSEEFLQEVANEALVQEVGARGLDRIMEQKIGNIFFNIYDYVGSSIIIRENGKVNYKRKVGKFNSSNQIAL